MHRSWAFWRRVQYVASLVIVVAALFAFAFFFFWYETPTCFDGRHNGDERGVDCGGACKQVCPFDVTPPVVMWAQSFKVTDGMYNAVAYVENRNLDVGTPALSYTFSLYDANGNVITERSGTTFLPPDSVYPIFEGRISVGTAVPARTFIEIEPVENWQKADTRPDDFVVRSRTLTGADSQPRLDATIFNNTLNVEEGVEIVATIFDVRGNALTASQSVVPRFEPREEQRVVFTWPEPIAKTIRSCEVPTDVILAIDLSGSMNDDGGVPPEPITSVLGAASAFVDRLRSADRVGLVTFASTARLREELQENKSVVQSSITNLSISPSEERGSTNIGDAIRNAVEEFASARHNQNARKVLVVLTDGQANAPGSNAEEYALGRAQEAARADIDVYAIGLGQGVNQQFLSDVASTPNHRFLAASASNIDRIYRMVSTAICEEGAAVIDIVPKVRSRLGDTR